MTIMEVIGRLSARKQAAIAENLQSYSALVELATSGGRLPSESQIESILGSAGKSLDDFTDDVNTAIHLKRDRELVATEPQLLAVSHEIGKRLSDLQVELEAELQRVRTKHAAEVDRLTAEQSANSAAIDAVGQAKARLCRVDQTFSRECDAREELARVSANIERARGELDSVREKARNAESQMSELYREGDGGKADSYTRKMRTTRAAHWAEQEEAAAQHLRNLETLRERLERELNSE